MIPNWRWGHGHRAAKGLAERQAASKHRRWNPNPGSLACLNLQAQCHPYDTLCSLLSLTVALPADRMQCCMTAEEVTTDRDKPHLNNEEQIKTYKTREIRASEASVVRVTDWGGEDEGSSMTPQIHCSWLSFSDYLFMHLASPCFPFPLPASLLGIGNSFTYVVFFYISFMRNPFRP